MEEGTRFDRGGWQRVTHFQFRDNDLRNKNHILPLMSSSSTTAENSMVRPRTPPDQLNEICPNLYLGDLTAAESAHVLEAYAITHIISLTSHRPRVPKHLGISKKHFRIRDNTASNILGVLPECIAQLEYILGEEDGGVDALGRRRRVLVHCRMGMSRSGGAVVAYVMKSTQCPAVVALEYVRQMRPIVHPNRAFMAQLELWGACEYDTSFLGDHDKYLLPGAAEADMRFAVEAGVGGAVEESEEDEGALLSRALEMSLEGKEEDAGAVEARMEEPGVGVEVSVDVEMHDITSTDSPTSLAPSPTLSTQSHDSISTTPSTIPSTLGSDIDMLISDPTPPKIPPLKLDATRTQPEPAVAVEVPVPPKEEWGMVFMQDGMKRCFEECLKDVEGEFTVRVV